MKDREFFSIGDFKRVIIKEVGEGFHLFGLRHKRGIESMEKGEVVRKVTLCLLSVFLHMFKTLSVKSYYGRYPSYPYEV